MNDRRRAVAGRAEVALLVALSLWVAVPEFLLRGWWVEDAAIAFSYARNLAAGDGLVAFAGGERVEGYSDPLWVALLAVGKLAGIDPFTASKVAGGMFAAACVPLVWAIVARMPVPGSSPRIARWTPMFAAALVASNAQHGIWASAGLENAMFSCLLALGTWRWLVEVDVDAGAGRDPPPWSALAFVGVAFTRPEGAVYAGLAFAVGAWRHASARRWRRSVAWLVVFTVPFVAVHAARFAYFAEPFPMPYYAKIVDEHIYQPLAWNGRSWSYLRTFAWTLGWGWLVPVFLVGVAGTRGWRGILFAAWAVALAAVTFAPGSGADPLRIALWIGAWAAVPLGAVRSERFVVAGFAAITLAFAFRAGGDWMAGYRFFSLFVVPISALYAVGVAEVASRCSPKLAAVAVTALIAAPIACNLTCTFTYAREPMTPNTTFTRVDHFDALARELRLERPWVAVDHAMGGETWRAPPDGRAIDTYGLTDLPFALHRNVPGFAHSYLLDPPRFDFAHLKGDLDADPTFRRQFVPLPAVKGRNTDNWMNRALVTAPLVDEPPAIASYGDVAQITALTWSPDAAAGDGLAVELHLYAATNAVFDVHVVLRGPSTVRLDAPPGYGDLFPTSEWRADEVFVGRYVLPLAADVPIGTYSLSVDVLGPDGVALAATSADSGSGATFADAVRIGSRGDVAAVARGELRDAVSAGGTGDCAGAERWWLRARDALPEDRRWSARLHARAHGTIDRCWADRAAAAGSLADKLADLDRAREWDIRSPAALAVGSALADETWPAAMAARASGDAARAFRFFDACVHADPRRAWARRYAEEARAIVLDRPPGRP